MKYRKRCYALKLFKKSMSIFLVFCFVFLGFMTNVSAKPEEVSNDKKIEKLVDQYMNEFNTQYPFSGSILISHKGKVVLRKAYGKAYYEKNISNTPDTKYTLASVTKQFVAVGIMMLQEQNKLNVNDPISKYIPGYPNGNNITIHNLLTHTSGIGEYLNYSFIFTKEAKRHYSVDEIIELFKNKPIQFKPGEKFAYCNSNYVLLGRIIQNISNKPCEDFLRDNIFKPLKMKNTGFYLDAANVTNKAEGYLRTEDGVIKCSDTDDFMDLSSAYTPGGMYSTVDDLYLWNKALNSNKLLKKESLDKINTPYTKDLNYGYGVMVNNTHDKKCIYHSGGLPGVENHFFRYIDDDTCIIILSNLPSAGCLSIEDNLYSILYKGKFETPKTYTEITLDTKVLDSFTGMYEVAPDDVYKVTREGNKLYIQETDDDKLRLHSFSQNEFFYKIRNEEVEFKNIENEKAMTLVTKSEGRVFEYKRIK